MDGDAVGAGPCSERHQVPDGLNEPHGVDVRHSTSQPIPVCTIAGEGITAEDKPDGLRHFLHHCPQCPVYRELFQTYP